LHATTDWRLLCRPISSIPAVRQLSAGKSVGRSDLRLARQRGEEGGKLREQRLRAESAQVVRRSALGRRPTRAGESARTRWSCRGGSAPAKSPGQFILSARESTLDKRRRRYRRAGVHTENAWKQTRRQRFGEGEEDTEDGNFYCFACWLIYHAARARLRRDSAHVQPARNFQGVSSAPGSAQQERSVQDASFASGRRPQLQRPSQDDGFRRPSTIPVAVQGINQQRIEALSQTVYRERRTGVIGNMIFLISACLVCLKSN
jgi:hypothetical protein